MNEWNQVSSRRVSCPQEGKTRELVAGHAAWPLNLSHPSFFSWLSQNWYSNDAFNPCAQKLER
jgi:hypothetical protein